MVRHQPADIRRQQLFMAALEVVGEKGYHATRVSDIVERAGLSKGAMYHQFKSKRELFISMFREMMEGYRDRMLEAMEQMEEAEAIFRLTYDEFAAHFEASPAMAKGMMEFYFIAMREEEVRATFLAMYQELVDAAAGIIELGVKNGEFAADIDPHETAWTFFTAGDGLVLVHLGLDQADKGFATCRHLLDIMLRGMRAPTAGRLAPGGGLVKPGEKTMRAEGPQRAGRAKGPGRSR